MFTIQLFIGLHTILETVQSTMTAFYQRLYSDIALIVRNAVYRDCFVGLQKDKKSESLDVTRFRIVTLTKISHSQEQVYGINVNIFYLKS